MHAEKQVDINKNKNLRQVRAWISVGVPQLILPKHDAFVLFICLPAYNGNSGAMTDSFVLTSRFIRCLFCSVIT